MKGLESFFRKLENGNYGTIDNEKVSMRNSPISVRRDKNYTTCLRLTTVSEKDVDKFINVSANFKTIVLFNITKVYY